MAPHGEKLLPRVGVEDRDGGIAKSRDDQPPTVGAGNLSVAGPTPSTGPSGTVTLGWSGLTPGVRYFGAILYSQPPMEVGRTLIAIRP